jgi:hypothetical protein
VTPLFRELSFTVSDGDLIGLNGAGRHHACDRRTAEGVSERYACLLLGQPRGRQHYRPTQREHEDPLTQAIVTLTGQYGCKWLPPDQGAVGECRGKVCKDRAARIWHREGLKAPKKHKGDGFYSRYLQTAGFFTQHAGRVAIRSKSNRDRLDTGHGKLGQHSHMIMSPEISCGSSS